MIITAEDYYACSQNHDDYYVGSQKHNDYYGRGKNLMIITVAVKTHYCI